MKRNIAFLLLRMLIGWHFLYEGVYKLIQSGGWSSAGYLKTSQWILASLFHTIAETPWLLKAVDLVNIWGLIMIGLALITGILVRTSAIAGVLLLILYYIAQPPFLVQGAEGHFLWIDRNLVEAAALVAIACLPALSPFTALRRVLKRDPADAEVVSRERRELLLNLTSLPVIGAFGYAFFRKHGPVWERENLKEKPDALTRATIKSFDFSDMNDLKKPLDQYGMIGNLKLSRMFLGGNLIGGWAHARDLIYVDKLVKAYHEDWRVFKTFHMAEQSGMNAILCNPSLSRVINDYWKNEGGKIQYISDCGHGGGLTKGIEESITAGAHSCYVQGGIADNYVRDKKFKELEEALALIRKEGMPAGIGAHRLETVQACVERGIMPDYWVKTIHKGDYWSARPDGPRHDNIWCENSKDVAAYMEKLEQPWIGFKVLAAGAIQPHEGFPHAFKSGADFICVGMYDFQLVDNVNLINDVLAQKIERTRPWRA